MTHVTDAMLTETRNGRRYFVARQMMCGLIIRLDDASTEHGTALGIPTCPHCAVLRDEALEGRLPVMR